MILRVYKLHYKPQKTPNLIEVEHLEPQSDPETEKNKNNTSKFQRVVIEIMVTPISHSELSTKGLKQNGPIGFGPILIHHLVAYKKTAATEKGPNLLNNTGI